MIITTYALAEGNRVSCDNTTSPHYGIDILSAKVRLIIVTSVEEIMLLPWLVC